MFVEWIIGELGACGVADVGGGVSGLGEFARGASRLGRMRGHDTWGPSLLAPGEERSLLAGERKYHSAF